MRWWVMAIVGTLVVFAIFLKMPPVAIGLAYLVFIAPRFIMKWMVETRRILLRDQMVQATVAMANSARAGLSQAQGLELVAQESADPLAKEFKRIVHDYHAGRPMADALTETQTRLKLESFDVFCSVVLLCMERGGKVSDALERISQSLMERQRLERKLEADTASGRRMALLLGAFPIVFLAGFTVLDPAMMSYMYTTLAGQLVLLLCGVMVYISVRWCMSILAIDF